MRDILKGNKSRPVNNILPTSLSFSFFSNRAKHSNFCSVEYFLLKSPLDLFPLCEINLNSSVATNELFIFIKKILAYICIAYLLYPEKISLWQGNLFFFILSTSVIAFCKLYIFNHICDCS